MNETLHRGPVLLEDLAGLLLHFRLNPVALVPIRYRKIIFADWNFDPRHKYFEIFMAKGSRKITTENKDSVVYCWY